MTVSFVLTAVLIAIGLTIYSHIQQQRRNERAIYFVAWRGWRYPYGISVDTVSDSEGANHNARDKTGAQVCIPVRYSSDADGRQRIVRTYVCGNDEMTDKLQIFGESGHFTRGEEIRKDQGGDPTVD